jgi:hypothetical protein
VKAYRLDTVVHCRCSESQKLHWESRAAFVGKDFSDWLRELCDADSRDTLLLPEVADGHSKPGEVLDSIVSRVHEIRRDVLCVSKTLESRFGGQVDDLSERLRLAWAGLYGVVDRLSG